MNKTLLFLLEQSKDIEEKKWYIEFLEKIGKEAKDLINDFLSFFRLIKENTYDALVEKFGYVGVTLVLSALVVIIFMVIVTRIIRGKDE